MKRYNLIILMIILFASCKKGKTEFFIVKNLNFSRDSYKEETFVISNPPDNKDSLMKLIELYNSKTLSQDEIFKYETYVRMFYKQGGKLTPDYKEESGHFGDCIELHQDKYLIRVLWSSGCDGPYVVYCFYTEGDRDSLIKKEYPSMKERYRMR